MLFQPLLCLLSIGLTTTLALPNPATSTSTVSSTGPQITPVLPCRSFFCPFEEFSEWDDIQLKCVCKPIRPVPTCPGFVCISEQEVYYDTETKICGCRWIPGFEPPTPEVVAREPIASSKPCAIKCRAGYHLDYNTTNEQCRCVKDDEGETICLAATECLVGSHPEWDAYTKTCSCQPNEIVPATKRDVDPSTCPTIRCLIGTHPVYNPDTTHCTCEADPSTDPATCPTIKCTATTHPVYHYDTGACSCEPNDCSQNTFCASGTHLNATDCKTCTVTDPIPSTCPQIKCRENTHVVYHPETDKCSCDNDCPGIACISEMHAVMNSTSMTCSCQWISGFPKPKPKEKVKARAIESAAPGPAPTAPVVHPCPDLMCIPEMTPAFNTTSQQCECEYISGLEPIPANRCAGLVCIPEMIPVYWPENQNCTCEWLPEFVNKGKRGAERIEERGIGKEERSVPACWDLQTGTWAITCPEHQHIIWESDEPHCRCAWDDGFTSTSTTTTTTTTVTTTSSSSCTSTSRTSITISTSIVPSPPHLAARAVPLPTPTKLQPCANMFCIPEMHLVFNATLGHCTCEWIPGLQPSPVSLRDVKAEVATTTKPIQTLEPYPCGMIFCISEQHGVWNATSGRCECEWIEGLGPVSV